MQISVNNYGALNIAEGDHRRCLMPGDSLIGETQEVIDAANIAWTPEVITAYQAVFAANIKSVVKPSSCTMKQARLALLQSGLLDQITLIIAGLTGVQGKKAQIIWEFSTIVDKHDALVQQLAPTLNLTDSQLDDLFALAVTL
jgi:hypothetical protein